MSKIEKVFFDTVKLTCADMYVTNRKHLPMQK